MADAIEASPGRVLGIGGIFFKSGQHGELLEWYRDKLGFQTGSGATEFKWRSPARPDVEEMTVWSVFPAASNYFDPSGASFMVNYIVDDLDALLAKLADQGVSIDPKREDHEYGRFGWIFDPDGNKIELWQPR
jgi:catechol 2,3-dioxygenase-like lactoylglutathione lyase family enzyme